MSIRYLASSLAVMYPNPVFAPVTITTLPVISTGPDGFGGEDQ